MSSVSFPTSAKNEKDRLLAVLNTQVGCLEAMQNTLNAIYNVDNPYDFKELCNGNCKIVYAEYLCTNHPFKKSMTAVLTLFRYRKFSVFYKHMLIKFSQGNVNYKDYFIFHKRGYALVGPCYALCGLEKSVVYHKFLLRADPYAWVWHKFRILIKEYLPKLMEYLPRLINIKSINLGNINVGK